MWSKELFEEDRLRDVDEKSIALKLEGTHSKPKLVDMTEEGINGCVPMSMPSPA